MACFSVNIAKFLRTPILKNIYKQLLLSIKTFTSQLSAFPLFVIAKAHCSPLFNSSCMYLKSLCETYTGVFSKSEMPLDIK